MDYSRLRIASVSESSLNEFGAFTPLLGTTEADLAHYGVRKCGVLMNGNASSNLDFNSNGLLQAAVATTLNCDADTADTSIASQNDWAALVYDGAGTIGDGSLGAGRMVLGLRNFTPPDQVEQCITEFQ